MLTVAILTHNDESRIKHCLKFINFSDEVLIVDDFSTDNTVKIAKELKARLVQQKLDNDFGTQRNRLLEQARGEWVLFIDPDEEVTTELANEIKDTLKEPKYDVYFIKRQDFFWNKPIMHGEVSKARKNGFIRLVKKGSGTWKGTVHEEFVTKKPSGQLQHSIHHYPHQTVNEFLQHVNFYSTLRAQELHKQKVKASIGAIIFLPFAKFLYTYFAKQGFRDGAAGFVYSFMMSFHSFLVRSKLYQYQHINT